MASSRHSRLTALYIAELSSGEESDIEGFFSDVEETYSPPPSPTPSLSPTLPPFEQCSPGTLVFNSSNPPSSFAAPRTMSDQLEDLFGLETLPHHLDTSEDLPSLALALHPLQALVLFPCISALALHLKVLVLLLWISALVLLHPPSILLLNQVHLRPLPNNYYKPSNYIIIISSKDVSPLHG